MSKNRENKFTANTLNGEQAADAKSTTAQSVPSISLPKGGGALRGIGEKFAANPVNGTWSGTVPIAASPGRSGFSPQLALSYDSGAGNGPLGLGWSLSLPSITRKTEKGIPRYHDTEESDVFVLSGAEDLVPALIQDGDNWRPDIFERTVSGITYRVKRYRPRIEGLFARIERWTNTATGQTHWRTVSPDNITTFYGQKSDSRIADPADANRVFSWLICESRDDKGNAIVYEYVAEDSREVDLASPQERNRSNQTRAANRYLKRVKYSNQTSHLIQPDLSQTDWLFELVFDYGDHDSENPTPKASGSWPCRQDPFSTYRSGFEVRTYRLCRRVLMFHHFPDELRTPDYLVRSTEFNYQETSLASFINSISHSGYILQDDGTYLKKSYPPVEFEYSEATVQQEVHEIDLDSAENLPYGIDGSQYQLVDLDGEGLSGILTDQGEGWFFKPNLGEGRFGPLELVALKPSVAGPNSDQMLDLAGDGHLDLVPLTNSGSGFYERTQDGGWSDFKPFSSTPNVDWNDPNLQFVDLTGDGHADILVTEDEVLTWYPSLAEEGFGAAEKLRQVLDEEKGPHLVFSEATQSIFVADMSGDGLGDLVRIRNGEICYWPNLGYGRFGAKVTMANAPWFDTPDQFDEKRLRLADIDGSGVTDIIYLKNDGIYLYFNQSGNSWNEALPLDLFPVTNDSSVITVADLLGDGTACIVWSSSLPGYSRKPLRYLKLLAQKPHLLTVTRNNMGAETRVQYAASTKFYLADQANGKPWVTKLPFPVHVVESVETVDFVSRNRFSSRYAYHHGYFDGDEREFRGFGMVEQWDTEAFADYMAGVQQLDGNQDLTPELFQPPVTTRTWFHTGAFVDRDRILDHFRDEYYLKQQHLPEIVLPAGLNAEEFRECLRALKGLPLRQEVYSFDGSAQEQHPYSVSENNFEIKLVQPRANQKNAVFFAVGRESVSLNYERNPADPRITHMLSLEVDRFGKVHKSCGVVYGRKITDASLPGEVINDQQKRHIAYSETDYTADINQSSAYRLRVAHESRNYEITGIAPAEALFQFNEVKAQIAGCAAIDYEVVADGLTPQKRLLSQARTLFLDNNLKPLPLGQWDSLGLTHQSYQLAFTPGVTNLHYAGKVTDDEFIAAGYVHFDGDANWWIPSGTALYPVDAVKHFFIPIGTQDPLGLATIVTFDKYDLLIERAQVKQASWTETTAVNDYRLLGAILVTDPNKNRTAVEIDALGLVVKQAVMGKTGAGEGDTLADPTARMEYELFNWLNHRQPNFVHSFAREQHGSANQRWQESYAYFNGGGGIAMVKAQAHPGKALRVNPDGSVTEVDANPRWVGNGRTVLNNKGNPVKEYQPYFSTTNEYEDEQALREIGVTPVLFYDAAGRNIRTDFPNGTFTKVEFTPWMTRMFDTNDTVRESQWFVDRGSPDPATEPEPVNDPERRAAWLAVKHANTPQSIHLNSLARAVFAVSDYGSGKLAVVRSESDLTGRFFSVFDQADREAASAFVCMSGTPIVSESAEKGRHWIFPNALGALLKSWDEHGRQVRSEYDELHRPVSAFVQEARQPEVLTNYVVYGDNLADAEQFNLLGVACQAFDQAGMMRVPEIDFKGNPKRVERVLAKDYKSELDWTSLAGLRDFQDLETAAKPILETEVFSAGAEYDALNRPTQITLFDGTVVSPTYNEANFLTSLKAQIRGEGKFVEFLKGQDYDAKGRRQFAQYGNDIFIRYFYDAKTFRLTNLVTQKSGATPIAQALQDLHYTFDPVGNITQIRDDAQQTHYFKNAVVKPENRYEYDAIYQLIRATGREHAGLVNDAILTDKDLDFVRQLPHINDAGAVRTYTEEYEYDLLGNLKLFRHRTKAQLGLGSGWTRRYHYAYEDDRTNRTNRLVSSSLPGDPDDGPFTATYNYDSYGNMIRMPHLAAMEWNSTDQLRRVDLGGGGTAFYVYGVGGERLRKVIERSGNLKLEWIFLGPVMIFRRRRRDTDELRFERSTVHISDNTGPIAQVDTKTRDDDNTDPSNPLNVPLTRYQYTNHLGSAVLETDDAGNVISYEEYHPYGTTSYRSSKPGLDLSLKRYRFSGKERDDETGLYYFGARYYAAWLGRWTSSDPAGFADGLNTFAYVRNRPTTLKDDFGFASSDHEKIAPKFKLKAKDTTGEERSIVGNPASDPAEVLQVFQNHGYKGNGPLKWVDDKEGGFVGWLDNSATVSTNGNGGQGNQPGTSCANSSSSPSPGHGSGDKAGAEPGSETALATAVDTARGVAQEAMRPTNVDGEVLRNGALNLHSGEGGQAAARQNVTNNPGDATMDNLNGRPTPEYQRASAEAAEIGEKLTEPQMRQIWGRRSFAVAFKQAFSGGRVVDAGGPVGSKFNEPGFIKGQYEIPGRIFGGVAAGALGVASGAYTMYQANMDPDPNVRFMLTTSGAMEASFAMAYGAAQYTGATAAAGVAAAGVAAFGGITAMIGFGVASKRAFDKGDRVGGWVNAAGAVGGAILLGIALFNPVGLLAVGLTVAAFALIGFATGYNLSKHF